MRASFIILCTAAAAALAESFSSSFTFYGSDDGQSPNCNNGGACGLVVSGFTAAVSQNLFGVSGGQGGGPACGTCWNLVSGSHEITVTVNNLCPIAGNILCNQTSLGDSFNSLGAQVDFDLCSDTGAKTAFFGDGPFLLTGTATEVDCP